MDTTVEKRYADFWTIDTLRTNVVDLTTTRDDSVHKWLSWPLECHFLEIPTYHHRIKIPNQIRNESARSRINSRLLVVCFKLAELFSLAIPKNTPAEDSYTPWNLFRRNRAHEERTSSSLLSSAVRLVTCIAARSKKLSIDQTPTPTLAWYTICSTFETWSCSMLLDIMYMYPWHLQWYVSWLIYASLGSSRWISAPSRCCNAYCALSLAKRRGNQISGQTIYSRIKRLLRPSKNVRFSSTGCYWQHAKGYVLFKARFCDWDLLWQKWLKWRNHSRRYDLWIAI